jgi:hypothetical protein
MPRALPSQRQGSVLIVVVGLCTLLLTAFLVTIQQVRAEANQADDVIADAQARIMLSSALSFINESARLGPNVEGETFGWTDIRTGAVGPLTYGQTSLTTNDGNLPGQSVQWPSPGSVYRADMMVWKRPPLAVYERSAPNPISMPRQWLTEFENAKYDDDPSTDPFATTLGTVVNPSDVNHGTGFGYFPRTNKKNPWETLGQPMSVLNGPKLREHWGRVWSEMVRPMGDNEPGYHRNIGTQPVADTLADFKQGLLSGGEAVSRPDSQNRAWFRLYRELPSDHDGDGTPYYDAMALSGHGTFIVTCGAGGTQGFASWTEVQNAGRQADFIDQATFELLQSQERRMWFRVEWSGFTGGAGNLVKRHTTGGPTFGSATNWGSHGGSDGLQYSLHVTSLATQMPYLSAPHRLIDAWGASYNSHMAHVTHAPVMLNASGTIKWIERLPTEPPMW